tara:strand:- start:2564 stop:3148 length:585 start_codon:yes stop_codon:yes gene_type:complete
MTSSVVSTNSEPVQEIGKLATDKSFKQKNQLRLVLPQGQLQVHTASYRGSFSVVLSEALRSAGLGSRVLIAQFLKGGVNQGPGNGVNLCGELEWIRPSIQSCLSPQAGEDPNSYAKLAINEIWDFCKRKLLENVVDRLVLDEIGLAIEMGFINEEDLIATLINRPIATDIILTGPSIPSQIMSIADQVTELRSS